MNSEKASRILQAGLDFGADFVEIFEEETRSSSLGIKDQKVETASAGTEYGVGLRLLFGTEVLYSYTSEDSEESLLRLVRNLAFSRASGKTENFTRCPGLNREGIKQGHPMQVDPRLAGQGYKLPYLRKCDAIARGVSPRITQVSTTIADVVSLVEIINSEGLHVFDERSRVRFSLQATAGDGEERISSYEAPGALGGYEILGQLQLEEVAFRIAERAARMLDAGYIAGGQMPVIMGNGFGGVIFHEACGHPLESESVRRKASPMCNKMGELIAHPCVTALDDGTFGGAWGSLNIDDEGMPVQRTLLIENGILRNYLADRVGALELGIARTGSGRRESYKYAPVSRMRNTFIAPGSDTFDSMLASVEDGLYAVKMGGGSVNPATGEFNFAVEEGYRIRKGKLAEPVRGATLIGKGHEILPQISMVGADLEMAAGMCGASSGSVPVTVGQPTLKVDGILVGGRA